MFVVTNRYLLIRPHDRAPAPDAEINMRYGEVLKNPSAHFRCANYVLSYAPRFRLSDLAPFRRSSSWQAATRQMVVLWWIYAEHIKQYSHVNFLADFIDLFFISKLDAGLIEII